ncbi:MAG: hypothetical protein JWP57_3124, partial [Spirosoma sp.]|nr:hypothetical protein [Spirosoma sp.]
VTLHYEEKIIRFPWNGDTKYYITSVEAIGPVSRPYGDASGYPGYQQGQTQMQQPPAQQGQTQMQQPGQMAPTQPQTMPADSTL